jgi:hypothetical protein
MKYKEEPASPRGEKRYSFRIVTPTSGDFTKERVGHVLAVSGTGVLDAAIRALNQVGIEKFDNVSATPDEGSPVVPIPPELRGPASREAHERWRKGEERAQAAIKERMDLLFKVVEPARDKLSNSLKALAPEMKTLKPPLEGEEFAEERQKILDRKRVVVPPYTPDELDTLVRALDRWHELWHFYITAYREDRVTPEMKAEAARLTNSREMEDFVTTLTNMTPIELKSEDVPGVATESGRSEVGPATPVEPQNATDRLKYSIVESSKQERLRAAEQMLRQAVRDLFPGAPEGVGDAEVPKTFRAHVMTKVQQNEVGTVVEALKLIDDLFRTRTDVKSAADVTEEEIRTYTTRAHRLVTELQEMAERRRQ